MSDPRTETPLAATRHEALGASFTDFGGWLMPVRYTLRPGRAPRRAHRPRASSTSRTWPSSSSTGAGAGAFLDYALAGRLSTLADDQAKYSLLLDVDGGIIDDVIVYRYSAERYMVVANAGNRDAVAPALVERSLGFDVEVDDATERIALIAVQGPAAQAIVEATAGITGIRLPLDELKYYRMTHADVHGGRRRSGPDAHRPHRLHRRGRLRALHRRVVRAGAVGRAARRRRAARTRPRGPRRPRHAAPRGRDAAVRPRALARHRARAGGPRRASSPPTRRTSSGAPGSRPSSPRTPPSSSGSSPRASAPAAPATPCTTFGLGPTRGRRDHERGAQPDARASDRHGLRLARA